MSVERKRKNKNEKATCDCCNSDSLPPQSFWALHKRVTWHVSRETGEEWRERCCLLPIHPCSCSATGLNDVVKTVVLQKKEKSCLFYSLPLLFWCVKIGKREIHRLTAVHLHQPTFMRLLLVQPTAERHYEAAHPGTREEIDMQSYLSSSHGNKSIEDLVGIWTNNLEHQGQAY